MTYLMDADLLPPLQSGFRPGHSDILLAVNRGDFATLVLLGLSVAFDTVDHDIFLQQLESSFGITDTAMDCSGRICLAEGNLSVVEAYSRLPLP